jgi:hypothetical protein
MIDLTTETPLSLAQAARLLPPGRRNRPVTFACILRWILSGCRAHDGQLVRLEAIRLGGRWVTSREAIQRFAEALTPQIPSVLSTPARTSSQRQRAAEQAGRELEQLGI